MDGAAAESYRRHVFSRSDYYRMAEVGILAPKAPVELIEGEIVDMPPIGCRHAGIVIALISDFGRLATDRALVACQSPVWVDDYNEPQPDVMLLRKRGDSYRGEHPRPEEVLLLVEVSDSTLRADLRVKLPLYARTGFPEVWIVDVQGRAVHDHAAPAGGTYGQVRRVEPPTTLAPAALPDVVIDLGALFGG